MRLMIVKYDPAGVWEEIEVSTVHGTWPRRYHIDECRGLNYFHYRGNLHIRIEVPGGIFEYCWRKAYAPGDRLPNFAALVTLQKLGLNF